MAKPRPAVIRPFVAGDQGAIAAMFARLSPLSRYRRFLTSKPGLSQRELARLADVDHVNHEALMAIDPRDGTIIGIARYVRSAGGHTAELAVEVADEFQRQGVGTALVEYLMARARETGITALTATVLCENRPSRTFARGFGFAAAGRNGTESELRLELSRG